MRGRIAALATAGLLALVATGCGGGDETAQQVPGPPADVSVPQSDTPPTEAAGSSQDSSSGNDSNSSNDSSDDSTSSDSTDSSATGDTGTSTGDTGTGTGTTDEAGGTAAPDTGDDSATNDQPPPEGSDAQQFEDFCAQNPGAC
jgi:hypothetical protein